MSIKTFIDRPITSVMIAVSIVIFGIIGLIFSFSCIFCFQSF